MISFQRLKDIREDKDISQKKMADILKIKRSTYSLWELGINIIPLDYLCLFADYFDTNIDYVLGLTNKKKSKLTYKGLNLEILGKNMKSIRMKNNLSQENIASILKVTQPAISKYEKGQVCISTSNLYEFCKEFVVPLNVICGKTEVDNTIDLFREL